MELAVIVGFLFIVAAVLLFFIRPIEIAKEKHDARLSEDARTVVEAIHTFSVSQGRVPWVRSTSSKDLFPALSWKPLHAQEVGICSDETCSNPGEVVLQGNLPLDFIKRDSIQGRNGVLFLGKGTGIASSLYACFVPISQSMRQKSGELYKIMIDQPFPAVGTLSSCSSRVTWGEEDVCYACVVK